MFPSCPPCTDPILMGYLVHCWATSRSIQLSFIGCNGRKIFFSTFRAPFTPSARVPIGSRGLFSPPFKLQYNCHKNTFRGYLLSLRCETPTAALQKRALAQTVGNVLCSVATPCNSRCPRDGARRAHRGQVTDFSGARRQGAGNECSKTGPHAGTAFFSRSAFQG